MSDQDLFISATIPWYRQDPANELARQLQEILSNNERYSRRTIEWRTDTVTDFRGYPVPDAAERLVRWDDRHPDIIFNEGFQPQAIPANRDDQNNANADLGTYVDTNVASVFVGTARYYHNAETNRNTRWQPRNIRNRFEYEIFAHGGIDVNLSLGSQQQFWNQREIAFPGGIRSEFIRTAREYDDQGHLVALWVNPLFDAGASGPQNGASLSMLPEPICGSSTTIRYWWGPPGPDDHNRLRREAVLDSDPMREDGEPSEDYSMKGTCPAHPIRACFQNPNNSDEAYFFADTRYALINVKPGSTDDYIVNGPKVIVREWPSLHSAHFARVDAVLPSGNDGEAYFFAQDQYALISVKPGTNDDTIINGPKNIATEWPSLREAGFHTIDAALPHPESRNKAYIFSGSQYVLIQFTPGTTDDSIINGPKDIASNWPSLSQAGFKFVDAALPNPADKNEAYFFSGERYVLVRINPGTTDDVIINGPKPVYTEWPSLRQAGFYGPPPPTTSDQADSSRTDL